MSKKKSEKGYEKFNSIDRFYWSNHSAIGTGLNIWMAIGFVFYLFTLFYFQPWTPSLGVANSPMRVMLGALVMYVYVLPIAFWLMKYWIDRQEWVAEANGEEYVPGKYYEVWGTKRVITAAIGMAMFGSSGAFWQPMLDVPGLIWQFLGAAYDPVVCWVAVTFGFAFIRGPLFAGMWDPFQISRVAIQDAPMLLFMTNMWWRWWRPKYLRGEMSLFTIALLWAILGTAVHYPTGGWTANWVVYVTPDPAFLAGFISYLFNPWWLLQFGGFKFIGVFVGVAVGKYVWLKKPEYVVLK